MSNMMIEWEKLMEALEDANETNDYIACKKCLKEIEVVDNFVKLTGICQTCYYYRED